MKRSTFMGLCAVGGLMIASAVPASAQIIVDDFNATRTAEVSAGAGGGTSGPQGPDVVGTPSVFTRFITANRTAGAGAVRIQSNDTVSRLTFSTDAATDGNGLLQYSLGAPIDLTSGGAADAFELRGSTDLGTIFNFTVFSASGSSTGSVGFGPGSTFPTDRTLLFSSFAGTANFAAVTGINVAFDGPAEVDTSLDFIRTRTPPRITEVVPEPGALALVLPGLLPLAGVLRRRANKK